MALIISLEKDLNCKLQYEISKGESKRLISLAHLTARVLVQYIEYHIDVFFRLLHNIFHIRKKLIKRTQSFCQLWLGTGSSVASFSWDQ